MKPVLQALLLADHIYQDRITGKAIIAGVFHRVFFGTRAVKSETEEKDRIVQIPVGQVQQAGTPYTYISLTELRGTVALQLRLVALESNQVCFESNPFLVEGKDPIATVEIIMPLPPLPWVPGAYALELLCENELIGSHRVIVQQIPQQE